MTKHQCTSYECCEPPTAEEEFKEEWDRECMRCYGRTLPLTKTSHFCYDWDFLPIDSTCSEFDSCTCFKGEAS